MLLFYFLSFPLIIIYISTKSSFSNIIKITLNFDYVEFGCFLFVFVIFLFCLALVKPALCLLVFIIICRYFVSFLFALCLELAVQCLITLIRLWFHHFVWLPSTPSFATRIRNYRQCVRHVPIIVLFNDFTRIFYVLCMACSQFCMWY